MGRLCLHPPNVPVLAANSTPAKATAWGGVAEGSCFMLLGTRFYPRDSVESTLLDPVLSSQCFSRSQEALFTPL